MPLRSGDQVQRHPQALAAITDGNPWREQRDEFTGSPADFHERHYREFVTFLPVTGSCWASLRSPQPTASLTIASFLMRVLGIAALTPTYAGAATSQPRMRARPTTRQMHHP